MITTLQQAIKVQRRRSKASKRGKAKAVKRFYEWAKQNPGAEKRT